MMVHSNSTQQDLLKLNNSSYPIANNFLTTFTKWAKIWVSSSTIIPCKRRIAPTETRETDIRSRINYYDQPQHDSMAIPKSKSTSLYRATCQKLRPSTSPTRSLVYLGDILHVRKCWDHLERIIYQDVCKSPQYLPPSQRLPFDPEKPGSVYLPRKSKRNLAAFRHLTLPKRKPFASTIVYNHSQNVIKVSPVVSSVPQDDDDVPLATLNLFYSKSSPLRK